MLLYDLLCQMARRAKRFGRRDSCPFGAHPLYELTDVIQLIAQTPYSHALVKRPAHNTYFAEFETEDGRRTGLLCDRIAVCEQTGKLTAAMEAEWTRHGHNERVANLYLCDVFRGGGNRVLHMGCATVGYDAEYRRSVYLVGASETHNTWLASQFPGVRPGTCENNAEANTSALAGLDMLWALAACKNASFVVHRPTARSIRQANRDRQPRPSPFRVLRLTRPVVTRVEQEGETTEERSKQRFHLVRGHFKNLTHPRYKEPGLYWWPSHWRGDETLGTVPQKYKVKP